MVTDSRRVQRFDAYVTYTATRTVDGADERAAIGVRYVLGLKGITTNSLDGPATRGAQSKVSSHAPIARGEGCDAFTATVIAVCNRTSSGL